MIRKINADFIPCKWTLVMRGIPIPSLSYSLCLDDCESLEHAILGCPVVRIKVLNQLGSWWRDQPAVLLI